MLTAGLIVGSLLVGYAGGYLYGTRVAAGYKKTVDELKAQLLALKLKNKL